MISSHLCGAQNCTRACKTCESKNLIVSKYIAPLIPLSFLFLLQFEHRNITFKEHIESYLPIFLPSFVEYGNVVSKA
jgi:hypothetical protein